MSRPQDWAADSDPAEFYEACLVPTIFAQWAHQLSMIAEIDFGDHVLDVGCGTGILARAARREVGLEGEVTGLDIDERMLAVAKGTDSGITWVKGDAQDLPFEKDRFDRVLSSFMLMFAQNRVTAVREMWRVLKPGGRLVLAVWESLDKSIAYSRLLRIIERFTGPQPVYKLSRPFSLGNDDTLHSLIRSAGIEDFDLFMRKGIARFPSMQAWVSTELRRVGVDRELSPLQFNSILHMAKQELTQYFLPNGELAIQLDAKIVSAVKP